MVQVATSFNSPEEILLISCGKELASSFPQTIASLQVSKSLSLVDSIDSTFYGTN